MTRWPRATVWAVVASPFLLLALWHWSDGPGLGAGDYAHYLLHARAVAEGQPYAATGYIYTDYNWVLGPRVQPPGLPLTILPIFVLFGEQLWLAKLLMLVFAAVYVLLAGRYFAERDNRYIGLGVALLAGLSPGIVSASTQIISDLAFAALLWVVIYLYDRPGEWRLKRIGTITLVGGMVMLYRIVGVAVIPAGLVYGLMHYRRSKYRGLAPLVIWAAIGLLGLLLLPAAADALSRLSLNAFKVMLIDPLDMLRHNVMRYRTGVFESHLYPFPWDAANDVFHVVSAALMLVGLLAWLPRAWDRFLLWFAVFYIGGLILLPISGGRYLWPMFPLLVFGLLNGIKVVCKWARGSWVAVRAEAVAFGVAVALAGLAIFVGPGYPHHGSLASEPDALDLFGWLQERAAEEDLRVLFVKPRVLSWETRIPAMGMFVVPGVERERAPGCVPTRQRYVAHLREQAITHVVEGDYGLAPQEQRVLHTLIDACSGHFTRLYGNQSFIVYRFLPEAEGLTSESG